MTAVGSLSPLAPFREADGGSAAGQPPTVGSAAVGGTAATAGGPGGGGAAAATADDAAVAEPPDTPLLLGGDEALWAIGIFDLRGAGSASGGGGGGGGAGTLLAAPAPAPTATPRATRPEPAGRPGAVYDAALAALADAAATKKPPFDPIRSWRVETRGRAAAAALAPPHPVLAPRPTPSLPPPHPGVSPGVSGTESPSVPRGPC